MPNARLQLEIEGEAARKEIRSVAEELKKIPPAAQTASNDANRALGTITASVGNAPAALGQLSGALAKVTPQMTALATATRTASAALGGGGGASGGGGGGSGGGGAGGGLGGAAAGAAGQMTNLADRVLKAAIAIITFRQALRLTEEVVRLRIEFDRLDFGLRAITGSWEAARVEADFFAKEVDRLGLNFRETIGEFIKIEAAFTQSGFTFKEARDVFTEISIATKALGLSSAATGRILYDFQEMASLGVVQMRQLRQVLMQVPGGLEIASRAMGLTTQEFHRLVHEGLMPADEFILKFSAELANTFGGAMAEAADNLESHVNRMKTAWSGFMAEIGKAPEIKAGVDKLKEIGETARILTEESNFFQQHPEANASPGAFLNQRFPNARRSAGFFAEDMGAGGQIDVVRTYQRMQAESVAQNNRLLTFQDAMTKSMTPQTERAATEAQENALTRLIELRQKYNAESQEGLEREKALIESNFQKEVDGINKMLRLFDPTKDAAKLSQINAQGGPLDAARAARDRALEHLAMKEQIDITSRLVKEQERLTKSKQELIQYAYGDTATGQIEKINDDFKEQTNVLIELSEAGNDLAVTYDQLISRRDKLLSEARDPRNRGGFAGLSIADLREQREASEKALLTESDARKYQELSQKIIDLNGEMTRRLAANSATIAEAFEEGLSRQAKSYGSFQERVAAGGAQVMDALDRGFTDAFTAMITGTKSASQAFADMARSIVADLVRIAVQQLIVRSILSSLGGLFGGGGTTATTSGVAIGIGRGHAGGVVGSLPRFHAGGLVGEDVLVNARRGEVIFTPEQLDSLGKALGKGRPAQQKIEILNGLSDEEIYERMLRNPNAIVNAIGQRRTAVRRILGVQ